MLSHNNCNYKCGLCFLVQNLVRIFWYSLGMELMDILFPRTCAVCSRWGEYLCSDCLNKLSLNFKTICPQCCKPSINGITHSRCHRPLGLDGLTASFAYKGVVEALLRKFKYGLVSDISETLFNLVISYTYLSFLNSKNWLVVPVPLHSSRLRWRGFNQAELLAQSLATYLELPYSSKILQRSRKTKVQSLLNGEERSLNMKDAFQLTQPKASLKGIDILLVDDVWTTGSTLKEAAKPLKRAGAKSVWGLVLAS